MEARRIFRLGEFWIEFQAEISGLFLFFAGACVMMAGGFSRRLRAGSAHGVREGVGEAGPRSLSLSPPALPS